MNLLPFDLRMSLRSLPCLPVIVFIGLGATACSDDPLGLFPAGEEPHSLRVEASSPSLDEGESTVVSYRVFDFGGREFEQLPHWVQPVWSSEANILRVVDGPGGTSIFREAAPTDDPILQVVDGVAQSIRPGFGRVGVQIADKQASVPVDVYSDRVTLRVLGVHLNQVVQRFDGTVPLVANKPGVLRVFIVADEPNRLTEIPDARIDLFLNGTRVRSEMVTATGYDRIPTEPRLEDLAHSWNVHVPAELAQPGLAYRIEVDPDFTVPRRSEERIFYPASGEPADLDIRHAPVFRARFVPIRQSMFGSTGDIGQHNVEDYLEDFRTIFPIDGVDYDFRHTYSTSLANGNATDWSGILHELRAVHVAEGSDRYYYGVLRGHNSGTAGIAFVGGRTALGWDEFPFATLVYVHELGHNFGRQHAPCNLTSYDMNYPHSGGISAYYGFDSRTGRLVQRRLPDLMGYCQPYWVSDYTYEAVFNYRSRVDARQQAAAADRQTSLVVWGSVEDGEPRLEPAFEAHTVPVRPSGRGSLRLSGYDEGGSEIFRYRFEPDELSHAHDQEHAGFAFALPLGEIEHRRLARLEVSAAGGSHEVRAPTEEMRSGQATPERALQARITQSAGIPVLRWDASVSPLAVVRDARTGQILSLARGGAIELPPEVDSVQVDFSFGVRSLRTTLVSR